ncbi:MAG TPA: ribonuclease P protein component [Bryobacteraceae bacterium]|nr:ribonuclease P protein component [Bryobacteraceae bacterium]
MFQAEALQPQRRVRKPERIRRTSDFRRAYTQGKRIAGQYFTAFCLKVPQNVGPRFGFTLPRALGKAVVRNRVKRRLREILRMRVEEFGPEWDIVINPRRAAFDASPEELRREVDRLITQCAKL